MKIAIKFHDNDFNECFRSVLNSILYAYNMTCWDSFEQDKEKLAIIINEISYGHYLLTQNKFSYGPEARGEESDTRNYLKITAKDLLVNEEVDKYVKNTTWNNYETIILDIELDNPIYTL